MFISGVVCGLAAIYFGQEGKANECLMLLIIMTINFVGHEIVKTIKDK